jgi:hypothetical protein
MSRPLFNSTARSLTLGLVLATAAASLAVAQGASRYDGQYVGTLTLNETIRGDCEPPPPGAQYLLKISAGTVTFDYRPHFSTTLIGPIDAGGNFLATTEIKHGAVQMKGRVLGQNVTAELLSPSCSYTFRTQ